MTRARCLTAVTVLFWTAASGCVTNPNTGKHVPAALTEDNQVNLGRTLAPEFEKHFGGRLSNTEVQAYVRHVGLRIGAATTERRLSYEYVVLSSSVPGTYSLPGGKIYITSGLVKVLNSERELAAALAHETGHVIAMHGLIHLQEQQISVPEIVRTSFGSDAEGKPIGSPSRALGSLTSLSHPPSHEQQADDYAMVILDRSGYNPIAMVELLQSLSALKESNPGLIAEMCRRHPLTPSRLEWVRSAVGRYGEARDRPPDWDAGQFQKIKGLLK